MKKSQNSLTDAEILRQKAEAQLITQQSKVSSLSSENDLRKLAHELQVHQIELEMQYEQLKQAKEESDSATKKYTELYDFAPSGYFTLTKLGEIIGLNFHGAELLGKERLHLINNRFGSSVSDQTKPIFNNFLDKIFTSKGNESCEVTISVKSKGIPTYVYLTGHVNENGEQCQISMMDITERKKAEEELKNRMTELTSAYKQLDMYFSDNKELKQFAYISSHQLQQPLRTIKNYIQILVEDYGKLFDDNAIMHLNTIKDSAQRMNSYILGLSQYSRLGLNKKLSSVNIKKLISDVINDLQSVIEPLSASIEVTEMPVINVYEDEFRQVFQNLISNAIKYQKKNNHPVIKLYAEMINENWKFSISDNGIGIPNDQFENVFNMFQRLQVNENEYEGSGIGLALCKKIIEIHHGKIWVESTMGQGTTVNFTIPNLIL